MDKSKQVEICSFFCHHNWRWVVEKAIEAMYGNRDDVSINYQNRTKELPSYALLQKVFKRYSLFRVEVFSEHHLSCAWTTCPAFEFLDAKDALYRHLSEQQASAVMPPTLLLPHDCMDHTDMLNQFPLLATTSNTPPSSLLLKAPLGSGGDSLYFVNSTSDILAIIQAHRIKAEATPGFIESLREEHGGTVPSWSLQAIVPSVVLSNQRKCQIRAYVVFCDAELFLYTDYEVRQPMWVKGDTETDDDDKVLAEKDPVLKPTKDKISPTLQADLEFCVHCTQGAVPYNFRRSKTHTERKLITEVEGALGAPSTREKITQVMLTAFRALKPTIMRQSEHPLAANRACLEPKSSVRRSDSLAPESTSSDMSPTFSQMLQKTSYHQHVAEMAIIGADLIIEEGTMQPYVVEINNNPAMPASTKTMTDTYRTHLKDFVSSLICLGIDTASVAGKDVTKDDTSSSGVTEKDNYFLPTVTTAATTSATLPTVKDQDKEHIFISSKLEKLRLLRI